MSTNTNRPVFNAVLKTTTKDGRAFWDRIGAAFATRDGNGYAIQLNAMPIDGRFHLLPPKGAAEAQGDTPTTTPVPDSAPQLATSDPQAAPAAPAPRTSPPIGSVVRAPSVPQDTPAAQAAPAAQVTPVASDVPY